MINRYNYSYVITRVIIIATYDQLGVNSNADYLYSSYHYIIVRRQTTGVYGI